MKHRWSNAIDENVKTYTSFDLEDFDLEDLKGTCNSFGINDFTLDQIKTALDKVEIKGNCTLENDNWNNSSSTETEIHSVNMLLHEKEIDIYDLVMPHEELVNRLRDSLWDACNEQIERRNAWMEV